MSSKPHNDTLERLQLNKEFLSHQNTAYRLMWNRLGRPPHGAHGDAFLEGVSENASILAQQGGYHQQERMIMDKKKSLNKALLYSYQSALVKRVADDIEETEGDESKTWEVRALMNSNKLKADYDEKIISIGFEHGYKTGTVFQWVGTGTYWLIYLQELSERAYFRGNCRRCEYEIEWLEDGKPHKTYAAVKGPVETKIDYIQKHGISVDNPNYSLNIMLPKNKETLSYFRRYSKFYLQDIEEGDQNICWRVEATDSISTPGILEINAVEYYANETEDDIENGIAGGLIVKNIDVNEPDGKILGETFIKPKVTYTYEFIGKDEGNWMIDKKYPVDIVEVSDKQIKLKWNVTYSGQFDLFYGDYKYTIVAKSLF